MLVFYILFLDDLKTSLLTVLPCLYTPHFLIGLRPRAAGKPKTAMELANQEGERD
jgi:hypothetical protein